jgi:endonuclease III-like uncharacterized protein
MRLSTILLRKGDNYKQSQGLIYNPLDNTHCAIGVIIKETGNVNYADLNNRYYIIQKELLKVMSIKQIKDSFKKLYKNTRFYNVDINNLKDVICYILEYIIHLNDVEHKSFKEIGLKLKSFGL